MLLLTQARLACSVAIIGNDAGPLLREMPQQVGMVLLLQGIARPPQTGPPKI